LGVESSGESKHLTIVVYILEEVSFRFLWLKSVDIAKRVLFVSESIIRRNDNAGSIWDFWFFVPFDFKVLSVF